MTGLFCLHAAIIGAACHKKVILYPWQNFACRARTFARNKWQS